MSDSRYTIDFGNEKDGKDWVIINDGVMGGLSDSQSIVLLNSILFKGNISLKNNGGFASLRNQGAKLKLSAFKTVSIRFRSGTKRAFSFRLSSSDRFYEPFYKHDFAVSTNDWQTATLKLEDFKQYNLSGETGNKLTADKMNKDFRMGIILYDKKDGAFEIEIDYILFN